MEEPDVAHEKIRKHLMDVLPAVCTTRNLIDLGMYKSQTTACIARKRGQGPKALYVPERGYLYEREAVIEYLINNEKKKPTPSIIKKATRALTWTDVLKELAASRDKDFYGPSGKKVPYTPE